MGFPKRRQLTKENNGFSRNVGYQLGMLGFPETSVTNKEKNWVFPKCH